VLVPSRGLFNIYDIASHMSEPSMFDGILIYDNK
jgi:hypothetical protein